MGQVVDLNRYRIERELEDGIQAMGDGYDPLDISNPHCVRPNYTALLTAQMLGMQSMFLLEWSHQLMCQAETIVRKQPVFIDFTRE